MHSLGATTTAPEHFDLKAIKFSLSNKRNQEKKRKEKKKGFRW